MAASLEKLIAHRYGDRNLPIAVILPDGARVPLSPRPELTVIARSFSGLKALASPAMGALARAYVRNEIDFTGSARRALAIAEAMVGEIAHGRESISGWLRHVVHQRRNNRANISHHYDVSNAFYRRFLDERMVYSCAYFRTPEDTLDVAQAQKLDHICRKLRLAPGEKFLDIGCGWGGADLLGGRALRRRRHRHHAVAQPVRARAGRDREARTRRPRAGRAARLPGPARRRALRQGRERRHVRARRGAALRRVFRQDLPRAQARRLGAQPRHHPQLARRGEPRQRHRRFHRGIRVPRRRAHARVARSSRAWPPKASRWSTRRRCASTTRARCGTGSITWSRTPTPRAREVGEERFRVWRIYMAGSAHAFDRGWMSLWQLLAGKPLADGRLPHPPTRDVHVRRGFEHSLGAVARRPGGPIFVAVLSIALPETGMPMSLEPVAAQVSALEFPCAFPIKVMGRTQAGFAQTGGRDRAAARARFRPRHAGNACVERRQLPVGDCTVNATSRAQLDDLYRELCAHSDGHDGAVSAEPRRRRAVVPAKAGTQRRCP